MPCFSLKGLVYGKKEEGLSEQIDISIETEKDSLYIERIRIEKLNLRFLDQFFFLSWKIICYKAIAFTRLFVFDLQSLKLDEKDNHSRAYLWENHCSIQVNRSRVVVGYL